VAAWVACGVLAAGAAVGLALYGWARLTDREDDGPPAATTAPAAPTAPALRVLVPAYFYPDGEGLGEWQRLLRAPDPAAVVIIANPDSGPGKVADPNFLRVTAQAREKGFTVIGYVSTKYAKRPPEEVKEDVDRWVRLYPDVQGIFFDEQASGADMVGHYARLYEYTRRQRGLRLVVGNPGTICAEDYLSRPAADVVCLVESSKPFSEFRPPRWAADYKAGRFAAVISGTKDPASMKQFVQEMAGRHIGYCYITDETLPNPWRRLPSYWEAELAAVRQANDRKGP
jgi:hypothetical protein